MSMWNQQSPLSFIVSAGDEVWTWPTTAMCRATGEAKPDDESPPGRSQEEERAQLGGWNPFLQEPRNHPGPSSPSDFVPEKETPPSAEQVWLRFLSQAHVFAGTRCLPWSKIWQLLLQGLLNTPSPFNTLLTDSHADLLFCGETKLF